MTEAEARPVFIASDGGFVEVRLAYSGDGEPVPSFAVSVVELKTLRAAAREQGEGQEAALFAFADGMVTAGLARDEMLWELAEAHWSEDGQPPPPGGEAAHNELMGRLEVHVSAAVRRKTFDIARQSFAAFVIEHGQPTDRELPLWEVERVAEAVAWSMDFETGEEVVEALNEAAAAEGLHIRPDEQREAIERARLAHSERWSCRGYFFSEEAAAGYAREDAWSRAFGQAEAMFGESEPLPVVAAKVAANIVGLDVDGVADAVVTAAHLAGVKLREGAYAAAQAAAAAARWGTELEPASAPAPPYLAALDAAPSMLAHASGGDLPGSLIERFGLVVDEAEEIAAAVIADAEAEAEGLRSYLAKWRTDSAPASTAPMSPPATVEEVEETARDWRAEAEDQIATSRAAMGLPPAASAIPCDDDLVEDELDLESGESIEGLTYPPGFVGDLIDWIVSSSERPSRALALGPALALTGALAGRRYQSETELRTNLYIAALAPSGYGKDHARKAVKHYCEKSGFKQFLGPARVMSASALRNLVKAKPSCIALIDEYGGFMQQITDARAGIHNSMIKNDLLELFTSASTSFEGAEFAGQTAETIYAPNLGIYGTSTPDDFWSKLSSLNALDGLLSRHILINVEGDPPAEVEPTCAPSHVPPELIEAGRRIVDGVKIGNLAALATTASPNARTVPYSSEARDVLTAFKAKVKHQAERMGSAERAALQRAVEHAIKLSLVVAIGERPENPEISASTMEWGARLAWHSTCSLINEMRDRIADSRREADFNRVLRLIRAAGPEGLPPSVVVDRTRYLDRRAREEILSDLQKTGRVKFVEMPGKGGRGRKSQRYVATGGVRSEP